MLANRCLQNNWLRSLRISIAQSGLVMMLLLWRHLFLREHHWYSQFLWDKYFIVWKRVMESYKELQSSSLQLKTLSWSDVFVHIVQRTSRASNISNYGSNSSRNYIMWSAGIIFPTLRDPKYFSMALWKWQ